jgi:hypothetical protein
MAYYNSKSKQLHVRTLQNYIKFINGILRKVAHTKRVIQVLL